MSDKTLNAAPDWPFVGHLVSNFDHVIDERVAERLRTEQVNATYPAAGFHADCWYSDGLFNAAVYCFHAHQATVTAPTPEDLMREVCDQFGWD